jgi:hypothetical protein
MQAADWEPFERPSIRSVTDFTPYHMQPEGTQTEVHHHHAAIDLPRPVVVQRVQASRRLPLAGDDAAV